MTENKESPLKGMVPVNRPELPFQPGVSEPPPLLIMVYTEKVFFSDNKPSLEDLVTEPVLNTAPE